MIARFSLSEVSVSLVSGFRQAVLDRVLPLWKQSPGNSDTRVMFSDECVS